MLQARRLRSTDADRPRSCSLPVRISEFEDQRRFRPVESRRSARQFANVAAYGSLHSRGKCLRHFLEMRVRMPFERVTRVYGERQSVEVDLDARSVRRLRAPVLPGPFGKMDVPFRQARESLPSLARRLAFRH